MKRLSLKNVQKILNSFGFYYGRYLDDEGNISYYYVVDSNSEEIVKRYLDCNGLESWTKKHFCEPKTHSRKRRFK